MVARGAGDVGCAHCTQFGATETCQVCKLLVCETCAADWTTCNEQAARSLRLGMGWRVRDVDPKGRYALVSRALKVPRIVDLRQLRWLGTAPLIVNAIGMMAKYPPRLTSDGLIVHADVKWVTNDTVFVGLRYRGMLGLTPDILLENVDGPLGGSTCVSAVNDKYAHVSESQRVFVVEHSNVVPTPPMAAQVVMHSGFIKDPSFRYRAESYEPLPRKVVSAIAIDGERDLLASATWREVAIHRMVEGKLERFASLDTGIDANITWLALTGRWLGYGTPHRLELRPLEPNGEIGKVALRHDSTHELVAAIARDGAYLAIGDRDNLLLHDLDRKRVTEFTEHSDRINYVRFASDDHVLISGDTDNRIVLRPRTADGYAKPVVKVALQGKP